MGLKTAFVLLGLCLIFLSVGCREHSEKIVGNIQAIFYHEKGSYTLVTNGERSQLVMTTFYGAKVTIFRDIPQNRDPWALVQKDGGEERVEIHIRSIDDINGAGWNHGKFGSGTTVKITP